MKLLKVGNHQIKIYSKVLQNRPQLARHPSMYKIPWYLLYIHKFMITVTGRIQNKLLVQPFVHNFYVLSVVISFIIYYW